MNPGSPGNSAQWVAILDHRTKPAAFLNPTHNPS
jgi:hypothetical protein